MATSLSDALELMDMGFSPAQAHFAARNYPNSKDLAANMILNNPAYANLTLDAASEEYCIP